MTMADRRRQVSPVTFAAVLAGLAVLLDVGLLLMGIPAHSYELANFATTPLLGVLGFLIARKQPANKIGWLMLAAAVGVPVTSIGQPYVVLVYRLGYRLPFGPVAMLMANSWIAPSVVLAVAILLFPNGRLPSPRWRWALWTTVAALACVLGCIYATVIGAVTGDNVVFDSAGGVAAVDSPAGGLGVAENAGTAVIVGCLLSYVVAQVLAWRRADDERRQQLKWLLSGAVAFLVSGIISLPVGALDPTPSALVGGLLNAVSVLGYLALPICMGVAILRYRLYDIDRIISRTLSYAILTVALAALYAGLVLLATEVLRLTSQVAVAAATLAAAALFNPLRRRVQRRVDRRFNRARYDADNTVAAFAARLQDTTDPDAVRSELIGTVHHVLEPAYLSLSLAGGSR